MKKNVVFGFLGTTLDGGHSEKRWSRWRPTVGLCAQADFHVHRLELFMLTENDIALANQVEADIRKVSPGTEVCYHVLGVTDIWDVAQTYAGLHQTARAYAFNDNEQYYVHLTTGTHTAQICLFLLTEARYFPAQLINTQPDKAGQEVWRGQTRITNLDLSQYDLLTSRFQQERHESEALLKNGIPTRNPDFNRVISEIEKVCMRSTAPILLLGPTGAGKSKLASRIYELRKRRHLIAGAFVEVNCATLTGDNATSTLFGHKKGAFTGAGSERAGLLKTADGGILFLDEIGELGLDEQAKLLRALEDKRYLPLGSDNEVTSDFQLIAGTNCDLVDYVAKGKFRADLLARINLWTYKLPGLAQRVEDIEPNIDFELERASAQLNCQVSFNADARALYLSHALQAPWLGNFRELGSSVTRMATLAEGGRIIKTDVVDEIKRLTQNVPTSETGSKPRGMFVLTQKIMGHLDMDLVDAAQMEVVLQAIGDTNSMAEAGRVLFACSRREKKSSNDSDRVRKYLDKWSMTYHDVKQKLSQNS